MKYMNKEVKYIENKNDTNYTYITPFNVLTTKEIINKKIDHKLNF